MKRFAQRDCFFLPPFLFDNTEHLPVGTINKGVIEPLLIHGTADDNVHFRNCTEVSEAYVQAGKQFQMQVYTNRNHFIMGGNTRYHLFQRIVDFFNDKLQPRSAQ